MKITLASTNSGYNLAPLNNNFSLIEAELQNKVLYRDNPDGEPNQMEQDLDINNYNLLNVNELQANALNIAGTDAGQYFVDTVDEAYHWAQYPVDTPVPEGTGSEYSSYHYSVKADNSATQANTARIASETARDASQLALYNFEGRWYGVLPSEPTTDPNGDPITDGDLYVNDTDDLLYFYNTGVWNPVGGDVVASIFGRTGFVTAEAGDYDAVQVDYSNATSGLTATNVQAAIDEVEARADTAESDINSLQSTTSSLTSNIAPSIQSGAFNPESATLVWSGTLDTVPMTSLSEQGQGLYILNVGAPTTKDFSIFIRSSSEPAVGSAEGVSFDVGSPILQVTSAAYTGTAFELIRFTSSSDTKQNLQINSIYKV